MITISRNFSTKMFTIHWYLDSGSSDHFSSYEEFFDVLKSLSKSIEINTTERMIYDIAKERIQLIIKVDDEIIDIILNNILYAPEM